MDPVQAVEAEHRRASPTCMDTHACPTQTHLPPGLSPAF